MRGIHILNRHGWLPISIVRQHIINVYGQLAYCSRGRLEYSGPVEVLIVFNRIAVLYDAFCSTVGGRSTVGHFISSIF